MRKQFIFILMMCSIFAIELHANTLLDQAESAYNAKKYEKAIELYKKVIDQEGFSTELYYNLGNAYYKNSDLGNAILYYERSLKLNPSNDAARNNLEYAASKVDDMNILELKGKKGNVLADGQTIFDNIYRAIIKDIHPDCWAVIAIVTFFVLLVCVLLYLFSSNIMLRKVGFFGGLVFLLFTIISNICAYCSDIAYTDDCRAVITAFDVELKTEPADKSEKSSFPLHKGTRVYILESKEDVNDENWCKVRLNSENIGWVKKTNIEII